MILDTENLKPYADPVSVSQLSPGETYFLVTYLDNHMLVPEMQTLVYLGGNLRSGDVTCLYFQDVESYATHGACLDIDHGFGTIYSCSEDHLKNIFELEKATEELLKCTLRRTKSKPIKYEFLGK